MKRKEIGTRIFSLAAIVLGLAVPGAVQAETIGTCDFTGYAYMGGTGCNANNESYFLAQPLHYDYVGSDMGGFAWAKFTVGTQTVDSAYLVLELLGVGGMAIEDASEDYPADLSILTPGDTDVETIVSQVQSTPLWNSLDDSSVLAGPYVVYSNGVYSIDITDIYNAWASGAVANHGLVLTSDSENSLAAEGALGAVGAKFASIDGSLGAAPHISTTIEGTLVSEVPEPASIVLLATGAIILLIRRK